MKCKFLFLDSENVGELVDGKLEDGTGYVKDKAFILDSFSKDIEIRPIYLKTTFGFKPLFIVKWDRTKPSVVHKTFTRIENSRAKAIKPEFEEEAMKEGKLNPDYITPELQRKLYGLKILGHMIKPVRKFEISGIMMLIIGTVVGILIMYSLMVLKIIKI
jgi:hypothetical protein